MSDLESIFCISAFILNAFEYKICSDLMVVPVVNVHGTEINLSSKVVMSEFLVS